MKGRTPTASEKRHMVRTRAIGCLPCMNMGIDTPAEYTELHHTMGKTKPDAHLKVLPLCPTHHRPYSKAGLHYNLREWEKVHGTQEELLEQVNQMLGIKCDTN